MSPWCASSNCRRYLIPPWTFCRGSCGSTPSVRAVEGSSWKVPTACSPLTAVGLIAVGLKSSPDSCCATAKASARGTPARSASSPIRSWMEIGIRLLDYPLAVDLHRLGASTAGPTRRRRTHCRGLCRTATAGRDIGRHVRRAVELLIGRTGGVRQTVEHLLPELRLELERRRTVARLREVGARVVDEFAGGNRRARLTPQARLSKRPLCRAILLLLGGLQEVR